MKLHHIVGGIFAVLILLVFVVACRSNDVDVDYHAPNSSHSKVHKAPGYKAPKFSKRK